MLIKDAQQKLFEEITKWSEVKVDFHWNNKEPTQYWDPKLNGIGDLFTRFKKNTKFGFLLSTGEWILGEGDIYNKGFSIRSLAKANLPSSFTGGIKHVTDTSINGKVFQIVEGECTGLANKVLKKVCWLTGGDEKPTLNEYGKSWIWALPDKKEITSAKCIGAVSNGKRLFSVWNSVTGIKFMKQNSMLEFKLGERRQINKIRTVDLYKLNNWLKKAFKDFEWMMREQDKRSKFEKEIELFTYKDRIVDNIYFKGGLTEKDIQGIETYEIIGLISPKNWNNKVNFVFPILHRGKKIAVTIGLDGMPDTMEGGGKITIEGSAIGDLGVFTAVLDHETYSIVGKVEHKGDFKTIDLQGKYEGFIEETTVQKGENIETVLFWANYLWALWTNKNGQRMGWEKIVGLYEALPEGYCFKPGRVRVLETPNNFYQLERTIRSMMGISL